MTTAHYSFAEPQIRQLLPHRPPMLLIDQVRDYQPEEGRLYARLRTAGRDATADDVETPGPLLLPAPLLIEGLAQSSGLLLRLCWLANEGADLPRFAAGEDQAIAGYHIPRSALAESRATFLALAGPGDRIQLQTQLIFSRDNLHKFRAVAWRGLTTAAPYPQATDAPATLLCRVELAVKFPFTGD